MGGGGGLANASCATDSKSETANTIDTRLRDTERERERDGAMKHSPASPLAIVPA